MSKLKFAIVFLIIFFGVLFFAKASLAATYYVSTSGDDRNAGSDSNYPWAHCPGMQGWTGSATLHPGDTVYFDRGSTWTLSTADKNQLLDMVGGVTYIGDTWGTGTRAKLTATVRAWNHLVQMDRDHATYETVLQGFELDGNNQTLSGCLIGSAATGDLTGAKKIITNCVAHDFGNGTNYEYGLGASPASGIHVSNFEITNNEVYNTHSDLIILYPSNAGVGNHNSNGLVRGNNVHDGGRRGVSWGCGILMKNENDNIIVEYNYIHDTRQGIGIGAGASGLHYSGTNLTIRYNIIARTTNSAGIANVGDCLFLGNISAAYYGNLIFDNSGYGARTVDWSGSGDVDLKFYNNTFYSNGTWYEVVFDFSDVSGTVNVDFRNNIIYAESGAISLYDYSGKVTTHSNNIYYRVGGGTLVTRISTPYTSANLSTYEPISYFSNPTFLNTASLPTGFSGTYGVDMVPNATGLSVSTGDALNHGATLGTPYNGAINFSGTNSGLARPQGSSYDIGAYEFVEVSDTTPPAAPSGVSVS